MFELRPSIPPASAPHAFASIRFVAIVDADIYSFNGEAYRQRLALQLNGVSPSDIQISTMAASVQVTALIRTISAAQTDTLITELGRLASSTERSSRALNVTVEAIAAPQLVAFSPLLPPLLPPSAPQTPVAPPGGDTSTSSAKTLVFLAVTGGGGVLAALALGLLAGRRITYLRKHRESATKILTMSVAATSTTTTKVETHPIGSCVEAGGERDGGSDKLVYAPSTFESSGAVPGSHVPASLRI